MTWTAPDSMIVVHRCADCSVALLALAPLVLGTDLAERQVEVVKRALLLCADCRMIRARRAVTA